MQNTTKRVWLVAAMVVVAGALGACADEPTGIEEPYTVQMDNEDSTACKIVNGVLECDD